MNKTDVDLSIWNLLRAVCSVSETRMTYETFASKSTKPPQHKVKQWLLAYCCCCFRKLFGNSEHYSTVQIRPRIVVEDSDSETAECVELKPQFGIPQSPNLELKSSPNLERRKCRRAMIVSTGIS